jgi:hypothetical protein
MTRKIIRLESLSLMDYMDNGPDVIQTTKLIEVGRPYDSDWKRMQWEDGNPILVDVHGDRDVVKIEYARNVVHGSQGAYVVTLKNGNEVRLPEYAFACEDEEDTK